MRWCVYASLLCVCTCDLLLVGWLVGVLRGSIWLRLLLILSFLRLYGPERSTQLANDDTNGTMADAMRGCRRTRTVCVTPAGSGGYVALTQIEVGWTATPTEIHRARAQTENKKRSGEDENKGGDSCKYLHALTVRCYGICLLLL